ncbi:MAG: indole-3-glycerol phosphate synthase TrpC [Chloroflexi bacterium]|nr:indole-3-glycerol phosphate synthase TrpC [Chloroflexota bacterium]
MANFLETILEHKYNEVAQQAAVEPQAVLEERIKLMPKPLDFEAALRTPRVTGAVALIAEIKKASPSKGLLCPDFNPAALAAAYAKAGASALSVLTDERFFMGHLAYLQVAKVAAGGNTPILRKDFIVDPYQLYQARAYGADAALLIMAALEDEEVEELLATNQHLGLATLVEVHNEAELERALKLGARIIGVNNRDLHTFQVNLVTTSRIAANLPLGFTGLLVSESGIATSQDIARLQADGASVVLIGETLVRAASTATGLDTSLLEQKIGELFR